VQAAFNEHYAAQCGFCTSGFIMATTALVERGGGRERQDAIDALAGHVCRCTGYVKILDAVQAAATGNVNPKGAQADMSPQGQEPVTLSKGSPA
jgi:carbon-monoxide dehydrogenase small subunit